MEHFSQEIPESESENVAAEQQCLDAEEATDTEVNIAPPQEDVDCHDRAAHDRHSSPDTEYSSSGTESNALVRSLRSAIASLDSKAVAELIASAPYLATAYLDPHKYRNALHELALNYASASDKPAAEEKLTEILKTFLTHDVDINERDIKGNTALHLACLRPGYPEAIRALLASGVDVNLQNNSQQTALHCAVLGEEEADVEALLEGGANPNAMDNMGHSPLHLAAALKRCQPLIKLLVGCGAAIDLQDRRLGTQGPAPLHMAARGRSFEGVKALLNLGARPDRVDSSGQTALHLAALHNMSDKIAKCMIMYHADVNARDALFGETPLHKAVKHEMLSMINILVRSRANVNSQDHMWETPLHLAAASCRDIHIWNMLMRGGGDPRIRNRGGHTPITKAQKAKNLEGLAVMRQFYPVV